MAVMREHTPGPWRNDHALIVGADGTTIAAITAEANARLIAMAPDLLALLKRTRSYIRGDVEVVDDPDHPVSRLAAECDAAIAKAEGRA